MCRMLLAVGKLPLNQLLDGIKLMASGDNERYAWHEQGVLLEHNHSWGAALHDELGWSIVRINDGIDERINDLLTREPDTLLLHARHATVGGLIPENVHPFSHDQTHFCHNGTIWGDIPGSEFRESVGTTDSERLHLALLDALDCEDDADAIRNLLENIEDCWSANSFLLSDDILRIVSWYTEEDQPYPLPTPEGPVDIVLEPRYYQMHIARTPDYVVISSEPFPLDGATWEPVPNHALLELDPKTLRLQMHPLA